MSFNDDTYKTGRKVLTFEGGIKASGTFAAGGGNAIIHNEARVGQLLSHVEAPTAIGMGKSDVDIRMKKTVDVKDASIGMQNTITVNYTNESANEEHQQLLRQRKQMKGESVKDYAESLKKLAFASRSPVSEEIILDQFRAGLKHHKIRENLREISNLTLEKAIECSSLMESMLSDVRPSEVTLSLSSTPQLHSAFDFVD